MDLTNHVTQSIFTRVCESFGLVGSRGACLATDVGAPIPSRGFPHEKVSAQMPQGEEGEPTGRRESPEEAVPHAGITSSLCQRG